MSARLSIIVPTHDGDGLERLFASIAPQIASGDEVIIVGDTHSDPLVEVEALVIGAGYRFLAHDAGHHCWGHCQLNAGIAQARGDYLVFNDDDDIFTPDAFACIRAAIGQQLMPRPLVFRFHCGRLGRTLPERYEVVESAIGGHCLVTPNIAGKVGNWTCRYGGDYDYIVNTLSLWPTGVNAIIWYDDIIAMAR